jgi:CDP-diacylglycerol--serine O-phosphatidyltransferase
MDKSRTTNLLRFTVPQVLTASRLILGMFAIYSAAQQQLELAARILVLGFITDVFDGALARRLGTTSPFGLLFDRFADYLYYVVSPTCLVVFLLAKKVGLFSLFLLTLPTVGGALRYAEGLARRDEPHPGLRGTPGLPTNVCAFYMLALIFLRREHILSADSLRLILSFTLPLLALLMAGPWRYPWLTDYPEILIPTAVGLYAMPFFYTGVLASITLGIIGIYVLFSPLLVPQHAVQASAQTGEAPPTRAMVH